MSWRRDELSLAQLFLKACKQEEKRKMYMQAWVGFLPGSPGFIVAGKKYEIYSLTHLFEMLVATLTPLINKKEFTKQNVFLKTLTKPFTVERNNKIQK